MDLSCVHSPAVAELMRCIRSQMESLITGLPPRELSAMSLGLAHSLSRYKLKFSPDKVNTMIADILTLLKKHSMLKDFEHSTLTFLHLDK
ncbi:nucleolar protein 58-like [Micropterus dolomieu]|uniref:nucleolar protein 58-like n=1 Tax=Micropterus dolomieu TaxID=147949 RepID=UPI001E8CDEF7|nr:nucleolar protein 58-like [Micropterus dolomieu]